MRVFGSIVQSCVLSMLYPRQDLTFRRAIANALISDDDTRNVLESLEELAEKSFGSFFVSAALDEDVEHVAILINGSPENVLLSTNGKHDLIHIPLVPTTRATTAQFIGIGLAAFQTPLSNCFIGHDNPALCQKFFHIAKTEREAKIPPYSMADDFGWKAKAFLIGRNDVCFHAAILSYCSALLPS